MAFCLRFILAFMELRSFSQSMPYAKINYNLIKKSNTNQKIEYAFSAKQNGKNMPKIWYISFNLVFPGFCDLKMSLWLYNFETMRQTGKSFPLLN